MQFPSFEKFSSESDIGPQFATRTRAINSITHSTAELLWCGGPLLTMRQLLDVCPNLTVFELVIPAGTQTEDVGWYPLVTPRALVTSLLKTHSHILETLHLNFHPNYSLRDPEAQEELEEEGIRPEDSDYVYPSLRGFENLTRLTIELDKLFNFRDLPVSLKSLHLDFCYFADLGEAYFCNLTALKQTWCPAIESVVLTGYDQIAVAIPKEYDHERLEISADAATLALLGCGFHLQLEYRRPYYPHDIDFAELSPTVSAGDDGSSPNSLAPM